MPLAFWRGGIDPKVLCARARRARQDEHDALNLWSLTTEVVILRDDNVEHVLICDGPRRLRLQLSGDSAAEGPVRLHYDVAGLSGLSHRALALRRLAALWRLRRLPRTLFPADPVALRRVDALRAWDASRTGASQRDIAAAVLGEHMLRRTRAARDDFDSLRKRVARLVGKAERSIRAGPRTFFGG